MLKRNIIIYIIAVVSLFVFTLCVRFSIQDRNVYSISNLNELSDIRFRFYGVYDIDMVPSVTDINNEIKEAEHIITVVPTGNVKLYSYSVMQEVTVTETIMGEKINDATIWISSNNGFDYNARTKSVYNFGLKNVMQEGQVYTVVLNHIKYNDTNYYFNEFSLGAMKCSGSKSFDCIDVSKDYSYGELAAYEYFAKDPETLTELYNLKEYAERIINEV